MIKPIFKHHTKAHTFIGQVVHDGDLHDVYTAKGDEYGEEIWTRNGNSHYSFKTMPISMVNGGGMKGSALEAAKSLIMAKRKFSKSGKKLGSLNEMS